MKELVQLIHLGALLLLSLVACTAAGPVKTVSKSIAETAPSPRPVLQADTREVVGTWIDDRPGVTGTIVLWRESGTLYMEREFEDGSSLKNEMVTKFSSGGKWFEKKDGSAHGDYYITSWRRNASPWFFSSGDGVGT